MTENAGTATARAHPRLGSGGALPQRRRAAASPPSDAVHVTASDLLRKVGMASLISTRSDGVVFSTRRLLPKGSLVREGARFDVLYFVLRGAFKSSRTGLDGYPQVQGFAFQGDVVGLGSLADSQCSDTVVALEDSLVAVLPFRGFVKAGREFCEVADLFYRLAGREIQLRSDALNILVPACSEVRVARFLLHLSARQALVGESPERVRLPMSRRDIASSLGIAPETVSRAMGALAGWGYIRADRYEAEISDMEGLRNFQVKSRGSSLHKPRATEREQPCGSPAERGNDGIAVGTANAMPLHSIQ